MRTSEGCASALLGVALTFFTASPAFASEQTRSHPSGLWGRPVARGGFHFQVAFGAGGGVDTSGLFHEMELGWTFGAGGRHTLALLHTFIQNKGILGENPLEPDLIGGWMLEYKTPLFFQDLEGKVALGLGGTHEQKPEGISAQPGFGAAYGLDLHFPVWPRFGPTLSVLGMTVTDGERAYFGAGAALGVTLF